MTIDATIVSERFGISGFVTLCTSDRPVPALKWVVGTRMIEIVQAFYLVKGYLRMALGAVLPEFVVMNIFVTACAFSK